MATGTLGLFRNGGIGYRRMTRCRFGTTRI